MPLAFRMLPRHAFHEAKKVRAGIAVAKLVRDLAVATSSAANMSTMP
ncbi:MAG TPA: hypothetical protein VFP84_08560 [Kofleriaceae bacterium]|nr:hypothetical protein [Kofleriaceae bacterium]